VGVADVLAEKDTVNVEDTLALVRDRGHGARAA
jgi:hypothetical protein